MSKANTHSTTRARRHQPPAANIAAQIEELLRIRQEAEQTAAFLIDALDKAEPDPDLEDGADDEPGVDDEPSLGSPEVRVGRVMVDGTPLWPEQEQRIDPGFDQSGWSTLSGCDDCEDEFDGREDDHDREQEHEGGDDHYAI